MKRFMILCGLLTTITVQSANLTAQSTTAFTYQGELMQNGNLVSGSYNMEFSLWSLQSGGTQLATQTINGVQVTEGRFTVVLNLGSENFITTTANRYLQIRVNGTTLSPRSFISRTPYSLQTRGIQVNEAATFVGIRRSDRVTDAEVFGLYRNTTNFDPFGGMYVETNNGGDPFYGYATSGSIDAYHYYDDSSSTWRLWAGGDRIIVDRADGDTEIPGRLNLGGPGQTFSQLTVRDSSPSAAIGIDVESTASTLPTILAENAGGGPTIWVLGNNNASLSGGGFIVAGSESAANIAIDNNEIMARNNGQAATLFLNADGGQIEMGQHRMHPALAYGKVDPDGSVVSASSNVTMVQRSDTGFYEINIAGGVLETDVILVTSRSGIVNVDVHFAHFDVAVNNVLGVNIDSQFNFVIYRP